MDCNNRLVSGHNECHIFTCVRHPEISTKNVFRLSWHFLPMARHSLWCDLAFCDFSSISMQSAFESIWIKPKNMRIASVDWFIWWAPKEWFYTGNTQRKISFHDEAFTLFVFISTSSVILLTKLLFAWFVLCSSQSLKVIVQVCEHIQYSRRTGLEIRQVQVHVLAS